MAAPPAISVSGLIKAYSETTGIFDVGLEVSAGTVMALLGPNGGRKDNTTDLDDLLARLDRHTLTDRQGESSVALAA